MESNVQGGIPPKKAKPSIPGSARKSTGRKTSGRKSIYNMVDKTTREVVIVGSKPVTFDVVRKYMAENQSRCKGLIPVVAASLRESVDKFGLPVMAKISKDKSWSNPARDEILDIAKYPGIILNLPFSNGETIQLAKATSVVEYPTFRTLTPLGEFGGLVGYVLANNPEDYMVLRLVVKATNLTEVVQPKLGHNGTVSLVKTDSDGAERVLKTVPMTNTLSEMIEFRRSMVLTDFKSLGDTVLKSLDLVLGKLGLIIESSHPERTIKDLGLSIQTRSSSWDYLTVDDSKGLRLSKPMDLKYSFGVNSLGDPNGNNAVAITVVVRRKGSIPIARYAAKKGLFPLRSGNVNTRVKSAAKDGKYLNHNGVPLATVKVVLSTKLFEDSNGQVQDGQAYMSADYMPEMLGKFKEMLSRITDPKRVKYPETSTAPKLVTYLNQAIDLMYLGILSKSNVTIKGWITGPGHFGKGTLVFRQDIRSTKDNHPVIYVDNNWIKYHDPKMAHKPCCFMYHSTVGVDYTSKRIEVINTDESGKEVITKKGYEYLPKLREQGISMSLIDRCFSNFGAMAAMAKATEVNILNLGKEIEDKGVSSLIDRDLEANDGLLDSLWRDEKSTERSKDAILKAMLKTTFGGNTKGLYPYITAAWWEGVQKDVVYLHPMWTNTLEGKTSSCCRAMVGRFPALSPAAARWVSIQFDKRVPVNGMVFHTDHFSNMQADVDGDKGPLLPVRGNLMEEIYESRPESYELPIVKGCSESKGATIAFPNDVAKSVLASVIRGAVAQMAVGLIDNELSSYGYYSLLAGDNTSMLIGKTMTSITKLQASLDSIKKQGEAIPEALYRPLPPLWKILRGKEDAVNVVLGDSRKLEKNVPLLKRNRHLNMARLFAKNVESFLELFTVVTEVKPSVCEEFKPVQSEFITWLARYIIELNQMENKLCKLDGYKYNNTFSQIYIDGIRMKASKYITQVYCLEGGRDVNSDTFQDGAVELANSVAHAAYEYSLHRRMKNVQISERKKEYASRNKFVEVATFMGKVFPDIRAYLPIKYSAFEVDFDATGRTKIDLEAEKAKKAAEFAAETKRFSRILRHYRTDKPSKVINIESVIAMFMTSLFPQSCEIDKP